MDNENKEVLLLMQRLMRVIRDDEDSIRPHVAIPALNYVLGFVLGQAIDGDVNNHKLGEVYSQVISEIDYSRRTTAALVVAEDAIDKAKH